MRVLFVGSPDAVQAAVTHGFQAPLVRLLEASAIRAADGEHVVLLEIPESTLAPFEQPNGAPGSTRTFMLPGQIAGRFPPLAVRGSGLRLEQPRGPRTARMVTAAGALLALAGAAVAFLAISGNDDKRSEPKAPARAPTHQTASARKARARPPTDEPNIPLRHSRALGTPTGGTLVAGVALPARGKAFFTWDLPEGKTPNPRFRRYGTYTVVRKVLRVVGAYKAAHPKAPKVGIADLSLPHGGPFSVEYGGHGHTGHQNGLEVDVLYPRRDRAERATRSAGEIDRPLAQDLLRRFLRAGASLIVVAPDSGLRGPTSRVEAAPFHEDHMHVRFPPD